MRKPRRQRNEEQRERQQAYRARLKRERRPGRDDVARVLFHWFVVESTKTPELRERLEAIGDIVVARLAAQGFDERASHAVFDDLVERYTREGWDFRRKPHLRASGDPQEEGRVDEGGDPIDEGGQ